MGLSRDQEINLIHRAQIGNETAWEPLIDACRPWIKQLACHFVSPPGLSAEDQEQTGVMALLEAVRRFDTQRGTQLRTYAEPRVRASMIAELARHRGLNDYERKHYRKVINAYRSLTDTLQRSPRTAEVAKASGVSSITVEHILNVSLYSDTTFDERWSDSSTIDPRQGGPDPDPYAGIMFAESANAASRTVFEKLGPDEGLRLLVLTILRESSGYGYAWDDIAGLLTDTDSEPDPMWEATICAEYPNFATLPRSWCEVQNLFARLNPYPTAEYLRQRYSRALRTLSRLG